VDPLNFTHPSRAIGLASALLALAGLASAQAPAVARPAWSELPVFVWRQAPREAGLDAAWMKSFGSTNLGRNEPADPLLDAGLGFYVDNAAGRNELHLDRDAQYQARAARWFETRDEALLIRQPCLSDPAVREELLATLARTLAPGRELGLGISLGDEVSWTPYGSPDDSCLCANCRLEWRGFLARERAAGRSELHEDFDLALASTDRARLALLDGETGTIHAWLLRRAFTQSLLRSRLEELSQRARELRPGLPQGLLGMIGRTAFGGVELEAILPRLDFAECYRVSDARELLFTLRRPQQRVVQTLFFDPRSPATPVWYAWESWMRGVDAFVIWSNRELLAHADYAAALERCVARMRELPRFAPRPCGVALVNDPHSIAFGWLEDARLDGPTWPRRLQGWQEQRGSRELSLRAWLRLLEDCGAMPGALPLQQVDATTPSRFPLLVLNHLRVLDAAGWERLRAYLAAGGALALRGDLGSIDAFGRPSAQPWLEQLRELAPERVFEFGPALDGYLEERMDGGAALRERVIEMLRRCRAPLAPFAVRSPLTRMPWLRTWIELEGGSYLCAALPNLSESHEREQRVTLQGGVQHTRLFETRAKLAPEPGFALQWLEPSDASGLELELRAGEPAVFRLVREKAR